MHRFASALLCLAAAGFGPAAEVRANTVDCGGNSISYAEVAPRHRGRAAKGPIQVLPHSLCADLIEERPPQIESFQLTIDPATAGRGAPAAPGRPRFPGP